jgi:hypothetical protein
LEVVDWTQESKPKEDRVTELLFAKHHTMFVRVIAKDMIPAEMTLSVTHNGEWHIEDVSTR